MVVGVEAGVAGAGVQGVGFAEAGVTVGLNVGVDELGVAGVAAGVFVGDDHGEVAAGLKAGAGVAEVLELNAGAGLAELVCAAGV